MGELKGSRYAPFVCPKPENRRITLEEKQLTLPGIKNPVGRPKKLKTKSRRVSQREYQESLRERGFIRKEFLIDEEVNNLISDLEKKTLKSKNEILSKSIKDYYKQVFITIDDRN